MHEGKRMRKIHTHLLVPALMGGLVVCVILIIAQAWIHAEYRARCNPLDGCGPAMPAVHTYSLPATETPPSDGPTAAAPPPTPTTATTTATSTETQYTPKLSTVSPQEGPVGTVVTLTGSDLAGFEGDLDAWIVDERGVAAHLPQYFDALGPDTDPGIDTIMVEIPERACTTNNTYSGNECQRYLELTPGTYRLYAWPFGEKSNELAFTITDPSGCAQLTEAACFHTAECKAWYGPSSCIGNECTADEVFQGCTTLSKANRAQARIPLSNTDDPFASRAFVSVESWPPLVYGGFVGVPACAPNADSPRSLADTSTVLVSNATYCRSIVETQTATSTERTYVYTTNESMGSLKLWFTLRYTNCNTLADTADTVACRAEQATLDLDQTIDTLIRALLARS